MWSWLSCYLSGRHDYGVSCEPGSIFLRCVNCGKRSNGWAVHGQQQPALVTAPVRAGHHTAAKVARSLPFTPRGIVRHEHTA